MVLGNSSQSECFLSSMLLVDFRICLFEHLVDLLVSSFAGHRVEPTAITVQLYIGTEFRVSTVGEEILTYHQGRQSERSKESFFDCDPS